MKTLFDNLFISSPNGGGLFLLQNGLSSRLDSIDTTGLSGVKGKFVRGVQPSSLVIYDVTTSEINQDIISFHDVHDVLVDDKYLYMVATSGNEIIKLNNRGAEIKRWVFPGERDSLHINSIAKWNGSIVFSAFGDFKKYREYKGKTLGAGFIRDLSGGEPIITGLSQPHSLVPFGQDLLLTNSEAMEIALYNPSGVLLRSKCMDGYTRGICVINNKIYVGLSRSRNISNPGVKRATVVALDSNTWDELGRVQLPTAEIYAIQPAGNSKILSDVLAKIASHSARKMASFDWKVALPLREAKRWRNAPFLQIHRYMGLL